MNRDEKTPFIEALGYIIGILFITIFVVGFIKIIGVDSEPEFDSNKYVCIDCYGDYNVGGTCFICDEWRDKTECEKGNIDYVDVGRFIFDDMLTPKNLSEIEFIYLWKDYFVNMNEYVDGYKINFSFESFGCRRKTLIDLYCEELDGYFKDGNECVDIESNSGIMNNGCKQYKYPRKEIINKYGFEVEGNYAMVEVLYEINRRC